MKPKEIMKIKIFILITVQNRLFSNCLCYKQIIEIVVCCYCTHAKFRRLASCYLSGDIHNFINAICVICKSITSETPNLLTKTPLKPAWKCCSIVFKIESTIFLLQWHFKSMRLFLRLGNLLFGSHTYLSHLRPRSHSRTLEIF